MDDRLHHLAAQLADMERRVRALEDENHRLRGQRDWLRGLLRSTVLCPCAEQLVDGA
jgi:regulator of replication initiation timing